MIGRPMETNINSHQRTAPARVAIVAVLLLIASLSVVRPSGATVGTITKPDLTGHWAATFIGQTGCGFVTTYFTFTLNISGSGSGPVVQHTSGCGDMGGTFTINISTLNSDGSGTGGIGCGTDCGWNLNIQVAPDRSVFNFVDVSPENPGNYIMGTAIHQ